jgi:hypothetical protein
MMSIEVAAPDPGTLRMVAEVARKRAAMPRSVDHRDGLERLGAEKALLQLAADLEATADDIDATVRYRP